MIKIRNKTAFALVAGLLATTGLSAQTNDAGITEQDLLMALIATMIVISLVALLLVFTILTLVRQKRAALAADGETAAAGATAGFSWKKLGQQLTDAVPVARESEIDMGHDYDGIRELDNNLPPWWKYGFYVSIVFSFLYIGYYHIFNDWSSLGEYEVAMAEHEEIRSAYLARQADMVNEETVTVLTDATALAAGKKIFQTNCVACHATDGGGNAIGPNLTDEYWLHGGSVNNVFSTIKYGVIEKGMTPWQDQLKPTEMQQVASYILAELQGSTPAEPKAPQGELYVPAEEADTAVDSVSIALNDN